MTQALLCPACGQSHSEFDSRCPACGAALPSATRVDAPRIHPDEDPLLGRQISHFRVVRLIGRGGMGVVYQAVDLELGREVALKFLSSPRSGMDRDEARFRREAQATAALDHPNIGTVHEIGEHEGRRFIAMAFYAGETLAARLSGQPGHRLPATEAAAIMGQLASALAAAHAAGVVHRDLKPDNVMILPDGRVKLLDFGLAKGPESAVLTERGFAVGTAAYMAPEQFRGESGPATDLWAFGAVLYEVLAGRRPFGGEHKGMVHAILHEDPTPLREALPNVPPVLEHIALRCLAKDPSERFSGASEILAKLETAGLWSPGGSGSTASLPIHGRKPASKPWAWAGAALLVLAILLIVILWKRQPTPTLYVAVLKPEITGSLPPEDQAQVASNLQTALLRTVAAIEGLAALDSGQINKVSGPPVAVARAMAAGELIAARADCKGDLCQVDLSRLAGSDGRVLWAEALQLPVSKPRLFADALAVAIRQSYADRGLRVPRLELETSEEDYRAYLDLRRQAADPAAYQEVMDRLGALRERAPGFLEIYTLEANLARRLYLLKGDKSYLEQGIEVANQARERAPGDPRPLANLFDLFLDARDYPRAEAVLVQLAAADPAGSLLRRGQLAEQQGRPQEALELLAEAVRLQPSWRSLLILSNAEYRQGRLDDARRHLADLLQRAPGNTDGLKALAQIELLSNPAKALALLRQIAANTPNTDSLSNLGVALLLQRQYSQAEESFRQALQWEPATAPATLNLADCLLLQGRSAEAHALYSSIVTEAERTHRGDWDHLGIKAQALAHLGEPTRAVETIQQALRLTPDNAQLAYEAAVVYTVVGDQNSALVFARRAAEGGVDAYWFALPFFDSLRANPAFKSLVSPAQG